MGLGWCAGAKTLRIATLSLVYSTAEYCAPVWCHSAHTRLINSVLNDALSIVTGCLRPTPTDHLPVLSGIQPAELEMTSLPASDLGSAAVWDSKRINPQHQCCLCLTCSGYPSNDDDDYLKPILMHDFKVYRMLKSSSKQVDDHYELPLPWKYEDQVMSNNKNLALKRLNHLISFIKLSLAFPVTTSTTIANNKKDKTDL